MRIDAMMDPITDKVMKEIHGIQNTCNKKLFVPFEEFFLRVTVY